MSPAAGALANGYPAASTVLGPYSPEAIRDLKDRVDGKIYVSGSITLVRALLADGLADELHLFVFPLALGAGQRLFGDGAASKLALAACEAYDSVSCTSATRQLRARREINRMLRAV